MLEQTILLPALIATAALSVVFRCIVWAYYRDGDRILPLLKLAPPAGTVRYYKRFDTLFAPLPFLYCWLDIVAAVLLFRYTGFHPAAGLLLVLVAAGRMRALQEVGHNALHQALCPSKKLQWVLANVCFQFPTIKRDMDSRFMTHVKEHHPNADVPGKDPNLVRVIRAGMVPGITKAQFVMALLFPITPVGLWTSVQSNLRDAFLRNSNVGVVVLRIVTTAAVIALYLYLGGWQALVIGYLVPVFAIYPLFAWWSLLVKHRWHTPHDPELDRKDHDYEHGRATDFPGISGLALRYLIFPMSDAYHLAHHIYPFVRSEYLPVIDRRLKVQEPRYTQYISRGVFYGSEGQPGALSELYQRLVHETQSAQVVQPS